MQRRQISHTIVTGQTVYTIVTGLTVLMIVTRLTVLMIVMGLTVHMIVTGLTILMIVIGLIVTGLTVVKGQGKNIGHGMQRTHGTVDTCGLSGTDRVDRTRASYGTQVITASQHVRLRISSGSPLSLFHRYIVSHVIVLHAPIVP